jgi:uncharacterized protein YkwD
MSWLDRLIAIIHSHSHPAPGLPPDPGPGPPRPPAPPDPAGAAASLLAATNRARAAAGLPALAVDPRLNATAQSWAAECARTGVLSHFGPGGSTPWSRLQAAGIKYVSASENAAEGQSTPEQVINDWISEKPPGITGHRDNVYSRSFTHAGVGCATGKDGRIFWVMDFVAAR